MRLPSDERFYAMAPRYPDKPCCGECMMAGVHASKAFAMRDLRAKRFRGAALSISQAHYFHILAEDARRTR